MKKGYITVLLTTSALLLGACSSEEPEKDVGEVSNGEVVVNNGELPEDKGAENSEGAGETEEVEVPTREVYDDEVPKTGREKIIQDSIRSEIPYGDRNTTSEEPDLSVEYVEVNGNIPEDVDYNIPYTLYFEDEKSRAVGGEGVVSIVTETGLPEEVNDSETGLYELELLDTNLFNDERGQEDRNKVQVTKQAYNRVVELSQNIYRVLDPDKVDNEVFIRVQALYQKDTDEIPYGIQYQAQSLRGDIQFNYIINNIQNGYTVNYQNGEIKAGGSGE